MKKSRSTIAVLLLVGCAIFLSACSDDSLDDHSQHQGHHGDAHRHGAFDGSDNSSPAPTPGVF